MQLFPPNGRVGYVPVILLGLAFSVACVVQSVRQGQLSALTTYDDVDYFIDALRRLQSFYDTGFRGLIEGYVASAPHSPTSTGVAFLAFLFIGVHDWAPALVNSVFVILLLLAVRHFLRDLPGYALVAIMVAVLAWPVMGFLVIEARPDVANGFLIAFGCVAIVEKRWIGCERKRVVAVALLFAAALLSKPSVFPITLALYAVSLFAASLVDYLESRDRPSPYTVVVQNLKAVSLTLLLVVPHYVLEIEKKIEYIIRTTFGAEKDLWAVKLPLYEHLTYYLWGEAGSRTMGAWFFIAIAAVLAAGLAALIQRRRVSPRVASLGFVFLVSVAFVSIPAHKSVFLGIQLTGFIFVFFLLACRSLHQSIRASAAADAIMGVASGALVVTALMTFQWHWSARYGVAAVEPAEITASRRALLQQVLDAVRPATSNEVSRVYLPHITGYMNSQTVNLEILKKRISSIVAFDGHRSANVDEHIAQIATATAVVVIAPDDNDVVRWLPSYQSLPAVAAAVRSDPGFRLIASILPPVSGSRIEVYSRAPRVVAMTVTEGFQPEEGPYPRWHLPRVRWGLGSGAKLMVREASRGKAMLRLRARAPVPDQAIEVLAKGRSLGECPLPVAGLIASCEILLGPVQGADVFDLKFKQSASETGQTILFLDVSIVDVM